MTLKRIDNPATIDDFPKNVENQEIFVKYIGGCGNEHYGLFRGLNHDGDIIITNFESGLPRRIERQIRSGTVTKAKRDEAVDYFHSLINKFEKEFDLGNGVYSAFAARKQHNLTQIFEEYNKTNDIFKAIKSEKPRPESGVYIIEPIYSGYRLCDKPLESVTDDKRWSEESLSSRVSFLLIHGFGNIPKILPHKDHFHELLFYSAHEIPQNAISLVTPHNMDDLEILANQQYKGKLKQIL